MRSRVVVTGITAAALIGSLAACGTSSAEAEACDGEVDGPVSIRLWSATPAGDALRQDLEAQVAEFNSSQDEVTVEFIALPEGNYKEQVEAAAASGDLPELLDFDGPFLHNYAWSNQLVSLDECLPDDLRADLLPAVLEQGTYDGSLYGLSQMESGLALYSRESVLRDAGIRIPAGVEDAWTAEELTEALGLLREAGYERPINLRWNNQNPEWFTHAFATVVWSAGGDLVDRSDYQTADGALNTPETVEALTVLQGWFEDGYVDSNEDDAAFESGRSPITWSGHWGYPGFHAEYGDDLLLLPLPDFGVGSRTGHGNWQWGITHSGVDPDASWRFIEFMLDQERLLRTSDVTGGVPVRNSVADVSENYGPDGPLRLYIDLLASEHAVSRPQTPAYPAITAEFSDALRQIAQGADVKSTLDNAVARIDRDISENDGYPAE